MQNILSGFLTSGLLPIGEDDEKLKLLEAAAEDLSKQINANPVLTHRFVLVGLDGSVPASDPVHKLAEKAVFEKWQTIANKIGADPVQVYRAVILRAVEKVATEKKNIALALTLIADSQPESASNGKEQTAIASMINRFEAERVNELNNVWVNNVEISFPKLPGKVKKITFNKEEFTAGLSRAAGPTDRENKAQANPNPHWPDEGQPWALEFSPRAAEAISSAFQNVTKGFIDELQEVIRESLQGLVEGVSKIEIRNAKSELLWIQTSLYSPTIGCSYRKLDNNDLLLYSVLDVSRAVTCNAPPSVDFFLHELVSKLSDASVRMTETLKAIGLKLKLLEEAQLLNGDTLGTGGRRGLLSYTLCPNHEETFETQTGFKDLYSERLSDLAVRLYRELQILKLLSKAS